MASSGNRERSGAVRVYGNLPRNTISTCAPVSNSSRAPLSLSLSGKMPVSGRQPWVEKYRPKNVGEGRLPG
eukprot:jgi/Tetstr1/440092/TSEL_028450.t1